MSEALRLLRTRGGDPKLVVDSIGPDLSAPHTRR